MAVGLIAICMAMGGVVWKPLTPVSMAIYTGGLLGVSATALLHEKKALITLSGIPFGGSITGDATFLGSGIGGPVRIGEPLASALKLRRISIRSVHRNSDTEISVVLGLPILGDRTVKLVREDTHTTF
jgi:hypothetical protein